MKRVVAIPFLSLIRPGEVVSFPDVNKTFSAIDLRSSFFEGEALSYWIFLTWCRMTEQRAKIDNVFLGSPAFGQRCLFACLDERNWYR